MKVTIYTLFLLLFCCAPITAHYCSTGTCRDDSCQNGTAPCQRGPGPCCPRVAPPAIAYDFSQEFNEKRVWMELRQGEWYICTQRVPLRHDLFYVTPNIVCTKAHAVPKQENAPEGARCWRSGKRTVCQNSAGEVTVHG